MTDDEAIAAVRRGERVKGDCSLHDAEKPEGCPGFNHAYRTIFCNSDRDVVECSRCGHQMVTRCDFDDEFA
jgi:hypothetical protein